MRVVLFAHSLASCWNHGNAHFLRGIVRALARRGHPVRVFEPADGWSRAQLTAEEGPAALDAWREAYPELSSELYPTGGPDLDAALDGADLVLVHEWTEPALVRAIGARRQAGGRFTALFHDTHHRLVTAPASFDLGAIEGYDGVLAFGAALRERYARAGWGGRCWVWHEAADTTQFHPREAVARAPAAREPAGGGDLVWVGNWGDEERSRELHEFLLGPARALRLAGTVHGVRYPPAALDALAAHGLAYRGWLPNHRAPAAFAAHRVTVHVPRRPYVAALPGIPTIRVFEALACGIPLVCSPWDDAEGLFGAGCFLVAGDGAAMARQLRAALADAALRGELVARGLAAISARHTCAHRVDELEAILVGMGGAGTGGAAVPCG